MKSDTRYATVLKKNPLFAELMTEFEAGRKAPGYNKNDLVEPSKITKEQAAKLEDWGL